MSENGFNKMVMLGWLINIVKTMITIEKYTTIFNILLYETYFLYS